MDNEMNIGSLAHLIKFYEDQMTYFIKIGMDKKTNNGVTVTPILMQATTRRLSELLDRKVTQVKIPILKNKWRIRRNEVKEIYRLWKKYTKLVRTHSSTGSTGVSDSNGGYD